MSEGRSRVLWHASRAPESVTRPTLAGRTTGEGHANSGLGLFCASGPHDYLVGFGATVFELTLREGVRRRTLPMRDFIAVSHQTHEREGFEALGRLWAHPWDVVDVLEMEGWHSQSIILADGAIERVQRHTAEQFLAIAQPRPGITPGANASGAVAIRRRTL